MERDGEHRRGGEAERAAGQSIRFYEGIGLVQPSARRANDFRDFDERDLDELRFVARSRSLGFSVEQCRALLDLYRDRSRASGEVKAIAWVRVTDIDRKITELIAMRRTLEHLIERCHGDDRPECPIIEDLAAPANNGSAR